LVSAGGSEPPQPKAAKWFQNPIQAISVTPLGPFSTTADGACPVKLVDGDVAYVKPRPDTAKNLVVAREKIAADLGHLLNLPVAPVVIRLPDPTQKWPHYSAMSLAKMPAARQWGAGGAAHLAQAGQALEELRVFWTWLGDIDHNGHPGNLLYAINGGTVDVLAIDHSYSLCHGNPVDPLTVGICQGYGTLALDGCAVWSQAAVTKIMSLDWGKIEDVVQRLQAVINDDERGRILRILKARRDHLATFLGL